MTTENPSRRTTDRAATGESAGSAARRTADGAAGSRTTGEAAGPTATTGPSRRRFIKSGLLAAGGAIVGGTGHAGAARDDASEPSTRGVMLPHQFAPDARFTVFETDLEWRPGRVDRDYAAHAIEYEFARSLRSFFFAESELPEGRTFRATGPRASPIEAAGGLVGVVAEPAGDR